MGHLCVEFGYRQGHIDHINAPWCGLLKLPLSRDVYLCGQLGQHMPGGIYVMNLGRERGILIT